MLWKGNSNLCSPGAAPCPLSQTKYGKITWAEAKHLAQVSNACWNWPPNCHENCHNCQYVILWYTMNVTMTSKPLPLLSRFSLDSCARLPSGAKAESAPCVSLENLELANRSNMDLRVRGMLPSRHTSLGPAFTSYLALTLPHRTIHTP